MNKFVINGLIVAIAAIILSVYFTLNSLWGIATVVVIVVLLLLGGFYFWLYYEFFHKKK